MHFLIAQRLTLFVWVCARVITNDNLKRAHANRDALKGAPVPGINARVASRQRRPR